MTGQTVIASQSSNRPYQPWINSEVESGIHSTRIILGGFSQGGATALVTGLTSTKRLGGVVGMSCYLPIANRVPELIAAAQPSPSKDVPFQMFHGEADPLVKPEWGRRSFETIKAMGLPIAMKTYPGLVHSAAEEEIEDLEKWLMERVGAADSKA